MVAVNHLLHGDAFLFCTDGYGNPVFVRPTDEQHFLTLQAKIAYVDVGRHIHTCEVTNMNTSVGIRQGGSNQCSFKFFHIAILIIYISLQSYVFRLNHRHPALFFFDFTPLKPQKISFLTGLMGWGIDFEKIKPLIGKTKSYLRRTKSNLRRRK